MKNKNLAFFSFGNEYGTQQRVKKSSLNRDSFDKFLQISRCTVTSVLCTRMLWKHSNFVINIRNPITFNLSLIKYNINFVENIFFMLSMNLKKKKWLWWRYSFNVLSIPRNVKLYESRGKKNKNRPFPFSIVYNYAIIRNTEFSSSRYPIYQRSIYEPYNCIELDGKIKISHSIFPHLI